MKKTFLIMVGLAVGLGVFAVSVNASTHGFYKDKTLRIVVGFSAGGGFDTYSRTFARHINKHLHGNPTVIVQNMPGAGSLVSANHVYRVAKPDGLTIGHFIGSLFMGQVLGRAGIKFDARKFEYINAPVKDTPVCVLTKASGITSMEKWMTSKKPIKLGGSAPGNTTNDHPNILKATIGLPVQVVSGYRGTSKIRLAAESGEVAGGCWTWDSIKATWGNAIESGDVMVVLQMMPEAHPDLPEVPLAIDFAKSENARQLIHAGIHSISAIIRPYVLPPGTPKDRVQFVRKAFSDTLKDPEFLADAKRSKLTLDPVSGEELRRAVGELFKLPPSAVARMKQAIGLN